MSIEAMKQALQALEQHGTPLLNHEDAYSASLNALRQAIEAAEKQEPHGYFKYDMRLDAWVKSRDTNSGVAFYTALPKREWVGLTDEEAAECWNSRRSRHAKNIEAKLREKNGC